MNMSDYIFSFQTCFISPVHWVWMNLKAQLQNETGILVMFSVHGLIKMLSKIKKDVKWEDDFLTVSLH